MHHMNMGRPSRDPERPRLINDTLRLGVSLAGPRGILGTEKYFKSLAFPSRLIRRGNLGMDFMVGSHSSKTGIRDVL